MSDRKHAIWTDPATNTVRWRVTDRAGHTLDEGEAKDDADADRKVKRALIAAVPDGDDDQGDDELDDDGDDELDDDGDDDDDDGDDDDDDDDDDGGDELGG